MTLGKTNVHILWHSLHQFPGQVLNYDPRAPPLLAPLAPVQGLPVAAFWPPCEDSPSSLAPRDTFLHRTPQLCLHCFMVYPAVLLCPRYIEAQSRLSHNFSHTQNIHIPNMLQPIASNNAEWFKPTMPYIRFLGLLLVSQVFG